MRTYLDRLRDWPFEAGATPHKGKVPTPAGHKVLGDKSLRGIDPRSQEFEPVGFEMERVS